MSAQFGKWTFDGRTPEPKLSAAIREILAPYGPDGVSDFTGPGIQILYLPFHTMPESRRERQPVLLPSGAVLIWDGRLDNRADLIAANSAMAFLPILRTSISSLLPMSVWVKPAWPSSSVIGLCRSGIRVNHRSCWQRIFSALVISTTPSKPIRLFGSTAIDALLTDARKPLQIQEEYIAGYLGIYPAAHLTPYVGIKSVPPSCCVSIGATREIVAQYWEFDARKRVRYRNDADYESHFRSVFTAAVRRRLRSSRPVLADLSGGLDSSSIVCVAHGLMKDGKTAAPRLDTVTYFDNLEPNWNELPFVAAVEQRLGRDSTHINVGGMGMPLAIHDPDRLCPFPGSNTRLNEAAKQFLACVLAQDNRVHLSGIGGDEILGGVPNPLPELADLFVCLEPRKFVRQITAWALAKRMPLIQLFQQLAVAFLPSVLGPSNRSLPRALWLHPKFMARHRLALSGYETRLTLSGGLPSFQANLSTLAMLKRQIASFPLGREPLLEKRYPLLDRDLLEYLFAIPREQLVRPGQRRSLMRRALRTIVPDEILNRRRKAFLTRRPIVALQKDWGDLNQLIGQMRLASLGVVDSKSSPKRFWRPTRVGIRISCQSRERSSLRTGYATSRRGEFYIRLKEENPILTRTAKRNTFLVQR